MITALFAVDEGGGMGKDGTLPWPFNKEDITWFKNKTVGQVVVMGKKSWDSPDMIKPLPKRHNVVFTNNFFDSPVDQIKGDVCEGVKRIEAQHSEKEVFIIGGAHILMQAIPVIDKAFITKIPGNYNCDTLINLDVFTKNMKLIAIHNLGSCTVEEYETIH